MAETNDLYEDLARLLEPNLSGTDAEAIHVDVADEITQIALKAIPLIDDVFVLEDAAGAAAKASATLGAMLAAPGQITALTGATPLAADGLAFQDASDSDKMKKTTVGALPIAQAQVAKGIREIANDGAVALATTDSSIIIADSTTGTKSITTASSHAGQQVWIRLVACTGNSYIQRGKRDRADCTKRRK
jgi:hypothetical protein